MYTKSIAAAALVTLVPSALAGSAVVHNKCSCDVYLWSISNSASVTMQTLSSGNRSYSEEYQTNPNGGGISIKIAKLESQAEITQFEYTVSGETIFYDVSNINGYPFKAEGLTLAPSVSDCPVVSCPAGTDCTEAYNQPDDVRTKGCASTTDLIMTLCPEVDPDASASAAPAASPTAATPTTSAEAAPVATSSPQVFAEDAVSQAAPAPIPQTWHSVHRRRGHGHGHRFARP
jgi:hypothetical protein